jgi:hypothetical protein
MMRQPWFPTDQKTESEESDNDTKRYGKARAGELAG